LSILLLLTPVLTIAQDTKVLPQNTASETTKNGSNDFLEGSVAGRLAAESDVSSAGWVIGGLLCGVGLGLIGTGAITLTASVVSTNPPLTRMALIQDRSSTYQMSFISEYKSTARGKKVWPALGSGIVGTLIAVVIVANNQ